MKKNLFLFAIVISLITLGLTSCDSSELEISESKQELCEIELEKLYNSIDSLHNEYVEYSDFTRGSFLDKWSRRFLVGSVDACVGLITAESGVGAFVCGTIASGLYDDYLDAVNKRLRVPASRNSSTAIRYVVFPTNNPTFIDSIGYYHNFVVDNIRSKGLSFVDENGGIDFGSYYDEVMDISIKNGVSCNVNINKTLIFNYIDSIIKQMAQIDEGDCETMLSIIFNDIYNDFKYDNSKTIQLRNICEKIIYDDLCMKDDKIVEYGAKKSEIIETSNVDNNIKRMMKIANNIAVNSSLYWGTIYEEVQN